MRCDRCNTEVQPGAVGATCPVCRGLLANSAAGALASPGRRLGAHIIDVIAATFLLMTGFGLVGSGIGTENPTLFILGLLFLLAFTLINLYFLTKSSSIGKEILSLKVYSTDGSLLGFWMMLFREIIGKAVSGFIMSLGFLWLLWDKDQQAWHDKIAGSVVLHTVPPQTGAWVAYGEQNQP